MSTAEVIFERAKRAEDDLDPRHSQHHRRDAQHRDRDDEAVGRGIEGRVEGAGLGQAHPGNGQHRGRGGGPSP